MRSKIKHLGQLAAAGLGLVLLSGCVVYDGPRYREVVVDDCPPPPRVVVVEPAPTFGFIIGGGGYYHGYHGGWHHRHWR